MAPGSERLRLAVEAGAEITRALAGDDAPSVIARLVVEALDVWECDLYEYDPVTRTLTAAAVWSRDLSPADLVWVGTSLSIDDRPGYAAVVEGAGAGVSRVGDPRLDAADQEAMQAWGELEKLAVPLRFRDFGVVGCLVLTEKREGRTFTDEDAELVTLLAGPAAVAVRNARLFRLQQEQNRYLSSLLDTGRAITTSITLEDSLSHICRTAAEALEAEECVIYEYDAPRDAIICRAFHSTSSSPPLLDDAGVYPLDDYPSDRRVLEEGRVVQETLADEGLPEDVRGSMERWGEKACLNVPLIVEGEPLGILVLIETEDERVFDAGEVELARALGEQAATAIRHARLYRRGERQNRRLAALLETSRVLASSLDVSAVLGEVRREVAAPLRRPRRPRRPDPAAGRGVPALRGGRRRRRPTCPPRWSSTSSSGRPSRALARPPPRTAPASSCRSSPVTSPRACSTSAPTASPSAPTSSNCCRSWPARRRPRWPTPPCTGRSSGRPSPTVSPASTTTATSTSASTRRSRAHSATGCRCRCS